MRAFKHSYSLPTHSASILSTESKEICCGMNENGPLYNQMLGPQLVELFGKD